MAVLSHKEISCNEPLPTLIQLNQNLHCSEQDPKKSIALKCSSFENWEASDYILSYTGTYPDTS
jgi:hypothetical protein